MPRRLVNSCGVPFAPLLPHVGLQALVEVGVEGHEPILAALALADPQIGAAARQLDDVVHLHGDDLGQSEAGRQEELDEEPIARVPRRSEQPADLVVRVGRRLLLRDARTLDLGGPGVDLVPLALAPHQERLERPVVLMDRPCRETGVQELQLELSQLVCGELPQASEPVVFTERGDPRAGER